MYVPAHNRPGDPDVLRAFVAAHPFATLVSSGPDGPEATHVPLVPLAQPDGSLRLVGHLARANDHWKYLEADPRAVAIFHGPQAFVSAAWYSPPGAISTWNYAVVHARGTARLVHDAEALHALVETMRAHFDLPETRALPYEKRLLGAIVGIEMDVARLEGRFKLEQRESAENQQRVREMLARSGGEAGAVAAMMAPAPTQKGA